MTMPDFQTLMRPVLEAHPPNEIIPRSPLRERLAEEFALTDEERAELLPSGTTKRFNNRLAWTLTHLAKAGTLERPSRGHTMITARGIELLKATSGPIGTTDLDQFPEYQEFRSGSSGGTDSTAATTSESTAVDPGDQTPIELIEASLQTLHAELSQELLDRLVASSPEFFEGVVIDLMLAMGYGGRRSEAGQRLGSTGDGGIDGIIREDTLGLDAIYLQAKRWQPRNTVGRPEIQGFVGALQGVQAGKGVFITTSTFTGHAVEYAAMVSPRVILIDGRELAQLMIDHGVAVSTRQTLKLRRLDEDYFLEGSE